MSIRRGWRGRLDLIRMALFGGGTPEPLTIYTDGTDLFFVDETGTVIQISAVGNTVTVVADIPARDAITGQKTGDIVKVLSDDDGKQNTFAWDGSAWVELEATILDDATDQLIWPTRVILESPADQVLKIRGQSSSVGFLELDGANQLTVISTGTLGDVAFLLSDTGDASAVAGLFCGGIASKYRSGTGFNVAALNSTASGFRVRLGEGQLGRLELSNGQGILWTTSTNPSAVLANTYEAGLEHPVGTTYVEVTDGAAGQLRMKGADPTESDDFVTLGHSQGNSESLVATVTGVDLDITTKQNLYTVPSGKTFFPTKVLVRDADGAINATLTANWGFNASADDVIGGDKLNDISSTTQYSQVSADAGAESGAAAAVFGFRASVAHGSARTATMDVFGVLL